MRLYCHAVGVAAAAAAAGACILAAGCSSRAEDGPLAGRVRSDALTTEAVVSCNSDGCWTAEAQHPVGRTAFTTSYRVRGGATFTGPAGATRRMGVCLLRQHEPVTPCATIADCGNAPATLPPGGSRYCVAPDGTEQKSCFYRGSSADYCAGTPADPNRAPIAPGTYLTPALTQETGATWLSLACIEGCAVVPGSISRPKTIQMK